MDDPNAKKDRLEPGLPKSPQLPPATSAVSDASMIVPQKTGAGLPTRIPASAGMTAGESHDRSGVFHHLVSDDSDITGLVAYSIYKQNKLDWLGAFQAAKGRPPNDAELSAYIIGEETPRRLATYRHLAEATLSGNGPDVDGAPRTGAKRRAAGSVPSASPGLIATYVGIAVLCLIGFWLAVHFTMASH